MIYARSHNYCSKTEKLKLSHSKWYDFSIQHIAPDYLNLKPICLRSFHFFIQINNNSECLDYSKISEFLDEQRFNKFLFL